MKKQAQDIARNRKALHDYEVLETYEAGIALTGTEVRSLRDNHCQLTDCFALIRHGEVWLHGKQEAPKRKLLLHKNQIRKLEQQTSEKGMALVPLKMYFNKSSLVKVELAVCRGKKNYDKRAAMAERDSKREIERALKERSR